MVDISSGAVEESSQGSVVLFGVLLDMGSEEREGGETGSSSESLSSSSASKDIPGKETMRRSMESTPSSRRTRSMASRVCWQRRCAGMPGR